VTDCGDTKLLQGLVRQVRKERFVNLILAEDRLILPEAQAPQPDHDVHRWRPKRRHAGTLVLPRGGRLARRPGVRKNPLENRLRAPSKITDFRVLRIVRKKL
jgi:hypothetical protein